MFVLKLLVLPLLIGFGLLGGMQETEPVVINTNSFQVDPVHSTAIFKVHHLGAGMFYGRFNDITGTINANDNSPSFDISIDVNSVDTNSAKLDGHLKSPDFFNVVEFPTMTFKSSSSKKIGDEKYEVVGYITIHGVTKPLTVLMAKTGQVNGRRGEMIGFETEFVITRSEFGMMYGVEGGALSDDIKVILSLEAGR